MKSCFFKNVIDSRNLGEFPQVLVTIPWPSKKAVILQKHPALSNSAKR